MRHNSRYAQRTCLQIRDAAGTEARVARTERVGRQVGCEALVDHALLGQASSQRFLVLELEQGRAGDGRHLTHRVDGQPTIGLAVTAALVEVLEAKANRIE